MILPPFNYCLLFSFSLHSLSILFLRYFFFSFFAIQSAAVPTCLFVICYVGFFYFLAKLVKEVSAVFEALINAAVTPASAIAFSFTWLLGSNAEPLNNWVIAGSVVVPLGVLVFKLNEIASYVEVGGVGSCVVGWD
jgi:roadblock/LC7 domain-containing protein